jgi:hypothetical protein
MKVQSFPFMQAAYATNRGLGPDDLEERKQLLTKYKYSVIVECEHLEFDNLNRWIKRNIAPEGVEIIYYGKTDYDYGFAEVFVADREHEEKLRLAVPNIYTTYPGSYPPGKVCKTDGGGAVIEYTPTDRNAIVYPADKE